MSATDATGLQALVRQLIACQEDERRMLARELHNDLGQQVTAIKLAALALQDETDAGERAAVLAEIIAITDQAVAKLRALSNELRPPQLESVGLDAALRWAASRLFDGSPTRLQLQLQALEPRADRELELACYRIGEEALGNAARHAGAQTVTLDLVRDDDALTLTVRDDGCGFDPAQVPSDTTGIALMRERAELMGGELQLTTAPGSGTCVEVRLPVPEAPIR